MEFNMNGTKNQMILTFVQVQEKRRLKNCAKLHQILGKNKSQMKRLSVNYLFNEVKNLRCQNYLENQHPQEAILPNKKLFGFQIVNYLEKAAPSSI